MVTCGVLSSFAGRRRVQCRSQMMREIKAAASNSTFFVLARNQPIAIGQDRSSAKAASSVPSLNTNLELSNDLIPSLSALAIHPRGVDATGEASAGCAKVPIPILHAAAHGQLSLLASHHLRGCTIFVPRPRSLPYSEQKSTFPIHAPAEPDTRTRRSNKT